MARGPKKGSSKSKKRRASKSAPKRAGASKRASKSAKRVGNARGGSRSAGTSSEAEIAKLSRELNEALERQTATADILKVIASSPSDAQPVFDAIASTANRLLGGHSAAVMRVVGDVMHLAAFTPINPAADAILTSLYPMSASAVPFFELLVRGEPYQEPDMEVIPAEPAKQLARARGYRSFLWVPLMNAGLTIGIIGVTRAAPGTFAPHEVQLLQTFADQAVIAIENARLFNETKEALARQTATAEVLQVISSSAGDLKPVFEAMLAKAMKLCEAHCGFIYQQEMGAMRAVAEIGVPPAFAEYRRRHLHTGGAGTPAEMMRATRKPAHVHDARDSEPYRQGNPNAVAGVDLGGARTVLYVPMIKDDDLVGVINLYRQEVKPFSDEQIALLESFASQAVIAIENARLFNETQETLARQTAMTQILEVTNSSPGDLAPVFDAILEKATLLCGASFGGLSMYKGDDMHQVVATLRMPLEFAKIFAGPVRLGPETGLGRLVRGESFVHILDASDDEAYRSGNPVRRALVDIAGARTYLAVPIRRDDVLLGSFTIYRREVRPFSAELIALVQGFAAQAAIAIENARLFNETKEALERQTATADVLKVIASSPANAQPVFEAIASSANRLLGGHSAAVTRVIGDVMTLAAFTPVNAEADAILTSMYPMPAIAMPFFELLTRGGPYQEPDMEAVPAESAKQLARARGYRSMLFAPLMNAGLAIGIIGVTRAAPGAFAPHEVQLLQTFADQAVIAIENARLFNETKEALERQTATSDILKVIAGSPSELRPVFDAIAARSVQLVGGHSAAVSMFVGDRVDLGAFTPVSPEADAALTALYPRRLADYPLLDLVRSGEVAQVTDLETDSRVPPAAKATARRRGFRSLLFVPMNSENGPAGVITVTRKEPGTFAAQHVQLMQTFADQAVIAIQNARLFNETREALERQTATADILKAIAASPDDVQPVFDAIAHQSNRLLGGLATAVYSFADDAAHLMSFTPVNPAADAYLKASFPVPLSEVIWGEPMRRGDVFRVVDTEEPSLPPRLMNMARNRGWRSAVYVPLLSDKRPIGAISVTRVEPGSFADHHVQLLRTFADQAVIAIQNVRLFNETKEALARQTATADVLKVIASSPSNLQPVFDAIAERSKALIGAHSTIVVRLVDGMMELAGFTPVSPEADMVLQSLFPRRPADSDPQTAKVLRGEIAEITDAETDDRTSTIRDAARARGWRSQLLVPLKDDAGVIGWISITRKEVGSFAEKDVDLLRTFADQAVIAISNVELFKAVQDRTSELSRSLDNLRAAQDRLVQTEKLASLGQLTAGIAHEIKNPLNFINNFSALSGELIDELDTALAPVSLDEKIRGDVGELTAMLKSNLEKVVQHGKRADSIVKNMLLHSREGSGERRSADINALVEESLNLAYHGARAERPDFQITLERELDPSAGHVELYPQEITRALLNMISNGFYAATRRAKEAGNGFEPTLHAATRGHSDRVEIRIRDNGTGIPPEVKERMFNPFFTTKPPGEGTGLGLSMTHDIVVKQHGGTIDVATEPGHFTEFLIVLPRAK